MKLGQVFVFFTGVIVVFLLSAGYYCIPMRRKAALWFRGIDKRIKIVAAIILGVLSVILHSNPVIFLIHFIGLIFLLELIDAHVVRFSKEHTKNRILKSCMLIVALFMIVLLYGYMNVYRFVATEYAISTSKEVPEGYKIIMISDLHYAAIYDVEELQKVQQQIQSEAPDMVVLAGDIVDEGTTKEQMEEAFAILGELEVPDGIYYVYGNHDRQCYTRQPNYTSEELDEVLCQNGICVLADTYVEIDDWLTLAGREDYTGVRKSVKALLEGADMENYLLMIDHQPVQYQENADAGVDLILSGHTHAGQIMSEGYYKLLMQSVDNYYGYMRLNDMQAIVSSGIAGWGYPLRLKEHAEYVVVVLNTK